MLELIYIKRHPGFVVLIPKVKDMIVKTSKTNQIRDTVFLLDHNLNK